MRDEIPFLSFATQSPRLRKQIEKAVIEVLRSDRFILGESLQQFEKNYATFNSTRYCAGTANGYDSLFLALKALDIGSGDEVIVPANTCMPTWLAVSMTGATPVPVEPDLNTYNINPSAIEPAITRATKAIVPVHLYGMACNMTAIMRVAKKHHLFVVEDNAQGHGARHNGQLTGSFGDINATSFYPTKNLGALGDGGAITTNRKDLFHRVCLLRNYGSIVRDRYEATGINSRLDEVQAAALSVKLPWLERWNNERRQIATTYSTALTAIGDILLPANASVEEHVFHLYVVRTRRRDKLQGYLRKKGIHTLVHYPVAPHLQPAYRHLGYRKGSFPITEDISETVLSLPAWPGMKSSQVDRVIDGIRTFYKAQRA